MCLAVWAKTTSEQHTGQEKKHAAFLQRIFLKAASQVFPRKASWRRKAPSRVSLLTAELLAATHTHMEESY